MTSAPAPRRPLERVALTLLADRAPTRTEGGAVIGVASVVDAGDVGGRAVELSRLLALHSATPTLLLEANLRTPSRLAAAMEMEAGPGVLDALQAPDRADEAVRPTPDPRLWVMTAGSGAPSFTPLGLADFGDLVATVRLGRWAAPRRVLDIRNGHVEAAPALVTVGAPAVEDLDEGEAELRPFNEGPPGRGDLGPLPPLPRPTLRPAPTTSPAPSALPGSSASPGSSGLAGSPGSSTPAVAAGPAGPSAPSPRRTPAVVVVAPPLDERSDGDVVVSQCDRTILLVHAGEATREQVADAVARIGTERLLGTVVVMPARRARRP